MHKYAGIGAASMCLALAVVSVAAAGDDGVSASASKSQMNATVSVGGENGAAKPVVPRARVVAKVENCVEAPTYGDRYVGLYGAMRPYAGTRKMQMRFTLLHRRAAPAKFTRVVGIGLDEWINLSPNAAVAIRHLSVSGVDTPAAYRGRIDYRWRGKKGKIFKKKTKLTNICKQTIPAPDLVATRLTNVGGVSSVTNYQLDVANNGGSEARSVEYELRVDGKIVGTKSADSMLAGASLTSQVSAATCTSSAELVIDPQNLVRESDESNNIFVLPCP